MIYEYCDVCEYPARVSYANEMNFTLTHDRNGGLAVVELASEHTHHFKIIPLIGRFVFEHQAPWSENATLVSYEQDLGNYSYIIRPDGSVLEDGDRSAINDKVADVQTKKLHDKEILEVMIMSNEVKGPRIFNASTQWKCLDLFCFDYTIRCSIDEGDVCPEITVNSDVVTKRVIRANDFVYEHHRVSKMVRGLDTETLFLEERDPLGRAATKTMLVDGRVTVHELFAYNKFNLISWRRLTVPGDEGKVAYDYDKTGRLIKMTSKEFVWSMRHDVNGNVRLADFGVGNTSFEYEFGSRVSKVLAGSERRVFYDKRGNLVHRLNFTFSYSKKNLLTKIEDDDGRRRISFFYDDTERVVLTIETFDGQEVTSRFFYGYRDNRELVSHVHVSGKGFFTLFYNQDGLLKSVQLPDKSYLFVSTDDNGTPEFVFDFQARLINRYLRSPFGAVLYEEDESVWLPLGYLGSLEDKPSGVSIIRGRPYDTRLGQWMVPEAITSTLRDPQQLFQYRFRDNDPVNPEHLRSFSRMNTFEDWLRFFGVKTPVDHLDCLRDRRELHALFGSVNVEQDLELSEQQWEPALSRGYALRPQILGPNIAFYCNDTTQRISTQALNGAGTLEQLLASAIHGTTLLNGPKEDPLSVHLHYPNADFPDFALKEESSHSLVLRETKLAEGMKIVALRTNEFSITWWIGFGSPPEAEDAMLLYQYILDN